MDENSDSLGFVTRLVDSESALSGPAASVYCHLSLPVTRQRRLQDALSFITQDFRSLPLAAHVSGTSLRFS